MPSSTAPAATSSSALLVSSIDSRDTSAKRPAQADLGGAPGEQRERGAHDHREEGENENAALRIGGESMYRSEHAGAYQESPEQTQRERKDRQKYGPAPEPPRFSVTASECISAVPTSQGMNEAFSTGSQNHQPPQPST